MKPWNYVREFAASASHWLIAALMLAAMAAAASERFVFHSPRTEDLALLIAIAIACVPLGFELAFQVSRRDFSVDILAFYASMGKSWMKHCLDHPRHVRRQRFTLLQDH